MKVKRANEKKNDDKSINNNIPDYEEPEDKSFQELEVPKDKSLIIEEKYNIDFKIQFKTEKIEDYYKQTSSKDLLKIKEEETLQVLEEKPFKLSHLINHQACLNEDGLKIVIECLIRKVSDKEEKASMLEIYKEGFRNISNDISNMLYDKTLSNLAYFEWGVLIGACTYKKFNHGDYFIVQILLICVKDDCRRRGIGTKFIETIKKRYANVVLFSPDKHVSTFFRKLGFTHDYNIYKELKDKNYLYLESRESFLNWGFKGFNDKEESRELSDMDLISD
jgi:ribosomal protein S18 acetylase RimI-like enzyme